MNESGTTILRPPWLALARIAWVLLTAASLLVFIVGGAKTIQSPLPNCQNPEVVCGPWNLSLEDMVLAQQAGFPTQLMLLVY